MYVCIGIGPRVPPPRDTYYGTSTSAQLTLLFGLGSCRPAYSGSLGDVLVLQRLAQQQEYPPTHQTLDTCGASTSATQGMLQQARSRARSREPFAPA